MIRFRTASPLLLLAVAPLLAGCVDREQADAKLAASCNAGIAALLPADEAESFEGYSKYTATTPDSLGERYRTITFDSSTNDDGWIGDQQKYQCTFEEQFGFLHSGYSAMIYDITMGDRNIGKDSHGIEGEMEDFIKLNDATQAALTGAAPAPGKAHENSGTLESGSGDSGE